MRGAGEKIRTDFWLYSRLAFHRGRQQRSREVGLQGQLSRWGWQRREAGGVRVEGEGGKERGTRLPEFHRGWDCGSAGPRGASGCVPSPRLGLLQAMRPVLLGALLLVFAPGCAHAQTNAGACRGSTAGNACCVRAGQGYCASNYYYSQGGRCTCVGCTVSTSGAYSSGACSSDLRGSSTAGVLDELQHLHNVCSGKVRDERLRQQEFREWRPQQAMYRLPRREVSGLHRPNQLQKLRRGEVSGLHRPNQLLKLRRGEVSGLHRPSQLLKLPRREVSGLQRPNQLLKLRRGKVSGLQRPNQLLRLRRGEVSGRHRPSQLRTV